MEPTREPPEPPILDIEAEPETDATSSSGSPKSPIPDIDADHQTSDAQQGANAELQRPDSPCIPKQSLRDEPSENVQKFRTAVMADLGETIKEIAVEDFMEKLLPPLDPKIDICEVANSLKQGPTPILDGAGWIALKGITKPKQRKKAGDPHQDVQTPREERAYEPFEQIVNAIVDIRPSTRRKRLVFAQRPNRLVPWTIRPYTGKPDGYGYISPHDGNLLSVDEKKSITWRTIVVTAEFKKTSTLTEQRNDNVTKICGDMVQVMRDDPTRRFTYGITLERSSMRMWYCDRSQMVVSASFDFMNDYASLIHFILSLAYPSSPWEIGFDLTMRPTDSLTSQYIITVYDQSSNKERQFRTEELIYSLGADALRGRGTRVWKAVELRDGVAYGGSVALKDTWVDSCRRREGDIMESILQAAPRVHQALLKPRMLSVICHGDVRWQEEWDGTRVVEGDGKFVLDVFNLKRSQEASNSAGSGKSDCTVHPESSCESRTSAPGCGRKHYRIVFAEVGESLRTFQSLKEAFEVLASVCTGLRALHSFGWVHRDISQNNIIAVRDPKSNEIVAKIADWEYARHANEDESESHGVRTATHFCTAVEVLEGRYAFTPAAEAMQASQESDLANFEVTYSASTGDSDLGAENRVQPPFRHNALHDLESLWWIAVYLLLYREIATFRGRKVTRTRQKFDAQNRDAIKLFEQHNERWVIFRESANSFEIYLKNLHERLGQAAVELTSLHRALHTAYNNEELDVDSIGSNVLKRHIHGPILRNLTAISRKLVDIRIHKHITRSIADEKRMTDPASTLRPLSTIGKLAGRFEEEIGFTKEEMQDVTHMVQKRDHSPEPSTERNKRARIDNNTI